MQIALLRAIDILQSDLQSFLCSHLLARPHLAERSATQNTSASESMSSNDDLSAWRVDFWISVSAQHKGRVTCWRCWHIGSSLWSCRHKGGIRRRCSEDRRYRIHRWKVSC